jgi:hypothetical protein
MLPSHPAVAVVGAGAVDCYLGGMRARAGLAVMSIGRELTWTRSYATASLSRVCTYTERVACGRPPN